MGEEPGTPNDTVDNQATTNESHVDSEKPVSRAASIIETPVYRQQYDARGHPEYTASREFNRQSRRAMNEVLAAVGICDRVDSTDCQTILSAKRGETPIDESKVLSVSTENTVGICLAALDLDMMLLLCTFIAGFRNRLQVGAFPMHFPSCAHEINRRFNSTLESLSCRYSIMKDYICGH